MMSYTIVQSSVAKVIASIEYLYLEEDLRDLGSLAKSTSSRRNSSEEKHSLRRNKISSTRSESDSARRIRRRLQQQRAARAAKRLQQKEARVLLLRKEEQQLKKRKWKHPRLTSQRPKSTIITRFTSSLHTLATPDVSFKVQKMEPKRESEVTLKRKQFLHNLRLQPLQSQKLLAKLPKNEKR